MEFVRSKTGIGIVVLIAVFAFLYFFTGAFGGTFIGLTLRSNPDLQNGLVGHWTFDGTDLIDNATDRSGSGNNGYLGGFTATTTAPGEMGQALEFDGTDDYISIPDNSSLDFGSSDTITLAAWVKVNANTSGTYRQILVKGDVDSENYGLALNNSNKLSFYHSSIPGYQTYESDSTYYLPDEWVHFAVTHTFATGSSLKLYVNGQEISGSWIFLDGDSAPDQQNEDLTIGTVWDAGVSELWPGALDDMRIYDRELSASEVSRLYELGATTKIAKTLDSNPDLENGLVGHWTFDSTTISGFTVSDSSGSNNDGSIIATSSVPTPGVVDASGEEQSGPAIHVDSGPSTVWLDENNGVTLYADNDGNGTETNYIASTTDGGATWGNFIEITSLNSSQSATLWYDGWTPGITSNYIHVLDMDSGTDVVRYRRYDPDLAAFTGSQVGIIYAGGSWGNENHMAITRASDGTLYATIAEQTGNNSTVHYCSSACESGADSWATTTTSGYFGNDEDNTNLLPIKGTDNVMLIHWYQSGEDIYSNIYSATSSSWWGTTQITPALWGQGEAQGGMGVSLDPITGDIYMVHVDDNDDYITQDHSIEAYVFDIDTYTWSQLSSPTGGDVSGGLDDIDIAIDSKRGYLYVSYLRRSTIGDSDSEALYWVKSIDGGQSWSGENLLYETETSSDGVRMNLYSEDVISVQVASGTGFGLPSNSPVDITMYQLEDITDYADEKPRPGNIGQGMKFDGVDDTVDLGDPSELQFGTDPFTLALWARPSSDAAQNEVVLGKRRPNSSFNMVILRHGGMTGGSTNSTRQISAYIRGNASNRWAAETVRDVIDGDWHHLVIRRTASGASLFVDGVEEALTIELDEGTSEQSDLDISGISWHIGSNGTDVFSDANIDDVRIYNRGLTDAEVLRLYQLGATTKIAKTIDTNPDLENGLVGHWTFDGPTITADEILDSSANSNHGGFFGGATTSATAPGIIGQGMEFDGSDDYVSIPDDTSLRTVDFSIGGWAKFDSIADYQYIVAKTGGVGENYYFYYDSWSGNEDLTCGFGPDYDEAKEIMVPVIGVWYHFFCTFDDTANLTQIYIDGVPLDSTASPGTPSTGTDAVEIGAQDSGTAHFDGTLDDIRIYDRALLSAEVLRLYQLGN